MRVFMQWLAKAPLVIQLAVRLYPPGVYRMHDPDGDVMRVVPQEYVLSREGELRVHVIADMRLNPEHPYMATYRITDVPLSKLEAIKWPPDARVH